MIELVNDGLNFSFPDVHPQAKLRVEFQRTLRIPDDGQDHFLPPGLGNFPLRHVDDFGERVPESWAAHGGVLLPMYQSEALWINFKGTWVRDRETQYPFAIKVAAGKIDAVTGQDWSNDLHARPQNYMVVPEQPWLDGFAVEKGVIRQFVAMPLGGGYTAEEQINGSAEYGGLQILVHPMKRKAFERRFPKHTFDRIMSLETHPEMVFDQEPLACMEMGLAPGGRMKQEIFSDPFRIDDWDTSTRARCFVHMSNSLVWEAVTGEKPSAPPPTARHYTDQGLPWFDYYSEGSTSLSGSEALRRLKSVLDMARERGQVALPENEPVDPKRVVHIRTKRSGNEVRDGAF